MDVKELPINFVSSVFSQIIKGYKWFVDRIRVKEIEFNDGTVQKSAKTFEDGVVVKDVTFGDGTVQTTAGGGSLFVPVNNIYTCPNHVYAGGSSVMSIRLLATSISLVKGLYCLEIPKFNTGSQASNSLFISVILTNSARNGSSAYNTSNAEFYSGFINLRSDSSMFQNLKFTFYITQNITNYSLDIILNPLGSNMGSYGVSACDINFKQIAP